MSRQIYSLMQLAALPSPHNNYWVTELDNGNTPNNIKNQIMIVKNQITAYQLLVEENVRSNRSTRQNASAIDCEK